LRPKPKKKKQRAVVDTNVVVAGISGFRDQYIPGQIPSADLLHRWAEEEHLVWLYSEDILAEYKEVLNRLHCLSEIATPCKR
jgi:predicted nucleic acid-binding protein